MYMRGHRSDYDEWAAMGNPGWSYAEVLPYFRKAENNQTHRDRVPRQRGAAVGRGTAHRQPVTTPSCKRACAEAGLPFNPDFNGAEQEGFNSVQVMMKHGERHHVGQAYIHPHLGVRANLHLRCETECTRILVENRRAVGVEVVANGERRAIRARREVILCAGGLLSAKLLQLSGVGDPEDFAPYGIAPVHVLPAVGRNLHDHIDVVLGYHIPGDPDLLGVSPAAGFALARGAWRWVRERRGLLATNFAELTGFMRLGPDSPKPEIQYEFVIGLAMDHGRQIYWRHGMSCHVMILHPKSRGTVRISSPDHRADPLIDFRYFSHPDDLPTLAAGAQRTARIFATPTLPRAGEARSRDRALSHERGLAGVLPQWRRHQLSPGRQLPHGAVAARQRGRRAVARTRAGGPAHRRQLDHAEDLRRQHHGADRHDRREGRRDDTRGLARMKIATRCVCACRHEWRPTASPTSPRPATESRPGS